MFCYHCGKTLEAGVTNCPHCGAAVGESLMSGHTSVQPKYVPVEHGDASGRYQPYTKTTYTSSDSAGDDVYSRTAYRPVLSDADAAGVTTGGAPDAQAADAPEAPEDSPKAEDAIPDFTAVPEDAATPIQKESLSRLKAAPEDAPDAKEAEKILKSELNIHVTPPKPIRKTGISPEVESYIQRMEAAKSKTRRKVTAAEDEAQPDAEAPETEEEETERPAKVKKPRSKAMKWVGRIVAALAIVALIVGGLVYLAYRTTPRAPIEGVSVDLYEQGVAMIKSRATDSYREEMIRLFREDQNGTAAVAKQTSDMAALHALMPATPMENDQAFMDMLTNIQDYINSATTTDALALLTSGDPSLGSLSEDSRAQWAIVSNAIARLDTADSLNQVRGISQDMVQAAATPTPEPTPTPSAYKTLTMNMTNNKQVKQLQNRLYQLGWFNGTRDGDFGGITRTAVSKFQQAAGLEVTGIADPATQEAAFAENAPRTGAKVTPAPDIDSVLGGGGADDAIASGTVDNDVTDQAQG